MNEAVRGVTDAQRERHPPSARAVLLLWLAWIVSSMLFFGLGPWAELQRAAGGVLPEEGRLEPAAAAEVLERLGLDGRARYRRLQLLDLGWALLGGLAFAGTVSRATLTWPRWLRFAPLVPMLTVVMEAAENGGLALASRAPLAATGWLTAVSWATRGKIALFLLGLGLTLAGLLTLALRAWARRRSEVRAERSARRWADPG